jgi:hypothetical protein
MLRLLAQKSALYRTFSTTPSSLSILGNDTSYRALLRNLRLLKGMRETDAFRVAITGLGAASVAERLCALEPSLHFTVAGDIGAPGPRF